MSVRSFCIAALFIVVVGFFVEGVAPVRANTCSFSCTLSYIPAGQTNAQAGCTTNTECSNFCARKCGELTNPVAYLDRAHPSTCSAGACTPCSCIPNVSQECTGTAPTTVCTNKCGTTCTAYNSRLRPTTGVARIACPAASAPGAPTCVVPPPTTAPTAASAGFCKFNCAFGPTRGVQTQTNCRTPADCGAAGLADTACRAVGATAASAPLQCVLGKCVATCTRSTTVSATDRGSCTSHPPTVGAEQCLTRCRSVCGARGMICPGAGSGAPTCTGTAEAGTCNFTCAVATGSVPQEDRATTCSYTDATTQTAANVTCAARCVAYCGQNGGGTCAPEPAATCFTNPSGVTAAPGSRVAGGTIAGSGQGTGRARTAPAFRATFPDPFGGNLTLQAAIGNLIRIAVGLCGIFFLGVFIYGGLLYLTSAGEPKSVQKGQAALVNAVIGLVIVLFSYIAVSLLIQVSDQLQTGEIVSDQSQNALDDDPSTLQPGGTTRATGRSSQGEETASTPTGGSAQAGTPAEACRRYYGRDPATCAAASGGACPAGATDLASLIRTLGTGFPAPSREVPDPAMACRTCLQNGVQGMQGLYPGIDNTCMPALANLWTTSCRDACNPRTTSMFGTPTAPGGAAFSLEGFCSDLLSGPAPTGACNTCIRSCQTRTMCTPGNASYIGRTITSSEAVTRQTLNCREMVCGSQCGA